MVRGFAHARLEFCTRCDEVSPQGCTFLFAVARNLIPAYMAVRVAVKFERPRATHCIDLGPSQNGAISFALLDSQVALMMTKQLRKFAAGVRVNAWRAVAGPARNQKAQGSKTIPLQHRMGVHPVVEVTVIEGQHDRLRWQRCAGQIRAQLRCPNGSVTRLREIGHLSRKAIG